MASAGPKTLRPEDEVSHYRIVSPLGAGGMGEVYLAQDQTLERNVALKILPPGLVRSEERVRRFVLEAKSASSLSHPNIVTIYEIGQDTVRSPGEPPSEPVHFISMELVNGKTLSTLIHEDKTDLRTLLGYLAQAGEGLAKAHAAGIVHRDLKPGNIMVSADGFAKVLDFGLAKLVEKRESGPDVSTAPTQLADATGEGVVVGTVGYMSPEQVQGKTVDHRTDIFSFGCILYEAVTRVRPFAAETGVETMHKILNEKPAPVEELNPKAPAELRRLIRRCLAKSPDQRLQSMKDLAIELREIVDEYDALSASASSGSISGSTVVAAAPAKRGLPVPAIAAIAIGVVAVAVLAWWGVQRGKAPATQPFQTMRMTPATSRGDVNECALSGDGRYLAYTAGAGGKITLRVRQIATGSDVEVLPPTDATIESPSFTPDGNYLFFRIRRPDAPNYSALDQVPSLGGTPQQKAFDVDSRATFSPDGKRAAFWRGAPSQHETRLVVVDLDSGTEHVLGALHDPETMSGGPAWSPDGSRIAAAAYLTGAHARTGVIEFDATTGRRLDTTAIDESELVDVAWLKDGSTLVVGGTDLHQALDPQLWLLRPHGRPARITNDFSAYASMTASADGATIASVRVVRQRNLWIADAAGAEPHQLTHGTAAGISSVAAGDSQTVVYIAPAGALLQVFAAAVRGGEPRALTTGAVLSWGALAAHGVVAFNRLDASGIHIWCVGTDGTGLRQVTHGESEQVGALSGDGRYLVYHPNADSLGVFWALSIADGKTFPIDHGATGMLDFSSDGRRVILAHLTTGPGGLSRPLFVARSLPDGAPLDSLLLPSGANGGSWRPGYDGMIFTDAQNADRNLLSVGFHGGAPQTITHFTDGRIGLYRIAPGAPKIAMVREVGDDQNVWVVDADGSHPLQVTHFSGQRISSMQWLPDGRRLVMSVGTLTSDAVLVTNFK